MTTGKRSTFTYCIVPVLLQHADLLSPGHCPVPQIHQQPAEDAAPDGAFLRNELPVWIKRMHIFNMKQNYTYSTCFSVVGYLHSAALVTT